VTADATDERLRAVALARATAAVLSLSTWVALLAAGMTACALWRVASGAGARGGWLADLALGVVALYCAVRVRLDQRLFEQVGSAVLAGASEAAALTALDAALATLGLRKPAGTARSLAVRAQAKLRLLRWQALLALTQLTLAVLLIVVS